MNLTIQNGQEPLHPPIIKYFDNEDKDHAEAIANFIYDETGIFIKPYRNLEEEDKGELEIWLLQKRKVRR